MRVFEYGVIRFVPNVERQEFINVGILISCQQQRILQSDYALDVDRIMAFAPNTDLRFLERHLECFKKVCHGEGPIGQLPLRERFHWLAAPRSTILQVSPLHAGLAKKDDSLEKKLEQLMNKMIGVPKNGR